MRWGKKRNTDGGTPELKGHDMPLLFKPMGESLRLHNRLWFYQGVDEESILDLVSEMRDGAVELRTRAIEEDREPTPLHLHIHSYGGSVFSGFAAVEAILKSKVPVHTHIEGAAASAATLMSVAGAHRTIGKHSFILIHQLSSGFWGKYEEMKDEMKNNDLLMAKIKGFYMERTRFPKKELDALLKRDLWLDADQALRYGLVDEVV